MSIPTDLIIAGIDISDVEETVEQVDESVDLVAQKAVSTLRTILELGVNVLGAFGIVIPQAYRVAADYVIVTVQTLIATQNAQLLSGNPAAIVTAAVGSLELVTLAALAVQLQTGQASSSQQLQSAVQTLRLVGGTLR